MAISLFPITPAFAAEVGDVDLAKPLSPEDDKAIQAAFLKYSVLVFPAQRLNSDQHVAFAERFGPLEVNINTYQDEVKKDRIDSRISDVSNLDHENELLPGESRKRTSGLANSYGTLTASFAMSRRVLRCSTPGSSRQSAG